MLVNIQIPDSTYQRLMATGSRVQGTIGLVNPTEGNFNEHNKHRPTPGTRYIRLRHGRASVGGTNVRLTLRVGLDEADIIPSEVLIEESRLASDFVDNLFDKFKI